MDPIYFVVCHNKAHFCGSLESCVVPNTMTVQCALSDKWRISTCRSCFLRGSQVDIKADKTRSISGHRDQAQRSRLGDNNSLSTVSSQRPSWFWGKCHMMTAESCAVMRRPLGAVLSRPCDFPSPDGAVGVLWVRQSFSAEQQRHEEDVHRASPTTRGRSGPTF